MTITPTARDLLAAIRANPHEDTPRLAFADAIEEDGQTAWAEFIRVQVEVAARDPVAACPCESRDLCGECTITRRLAKREQELWPAVRPVLGWDGYAFIGDPESVGHTDDGPAIFIRRGFPSIVRCTLAEWMGGECGCDQGSQDTGAFTPWGEPISERCPYCHGSGRTPGIGPRLAQTWSIERVEVTDEVLNLPKEIANKLPPRLYTPDTMRDSICRLLIVWAREQTE